MTDTVLQDVNPFCDLAPPADTPRRKPIGNFFAIAPLAWARACALGLNAAVAYLVLAAFSGRDNTWTLAGYNAVETHTGISRGRAHEAVQRLEEGGLLSSRDPGTLRRYFLLHGLVADPGHYDDPTASGLIWLPRALVDGTAGEAPLERIRMRQDVRLLRFFIDLYDAQHLIEEGGLPWRAMRCSYAKVRVGEWGPYTVVGYGNPVLQIFPDHPLLENMAGDLELGRQVLDDLTQLINMGLIEVVEHLVEGLSDTAEILHPCPPTGGTSIERTVASAADKAARMMMPDSRVRQAQEKLGTPCVLVPLEHALDQAEMVGILRLRYRPRTTRTSAWWQDTRARCDRALKRYEKMAAFVARRSPRQ